MLPNISHILEPGTSTHHGNDNHTVEQTPRFCFSTGRPFVDGGTEDTPTGLHGMVTRLYVTQRMANEYETESKAD